MDFNKVKAKSEAINNQGATVRYLKVDSTSLFKRANLTIKNWTEYKAQEDESFYVWINNEKLETITIYKGDVIHVTCINDTIFSNEVAAMHNFYDNVNLLNNRVHIVG